jgi:hypothetical protein
LAKRSSSIITLRSASGAGGSPASVEVGAQDLVLYAPDTCRGPVSVPIASVAFVVDLRERRARRLPGALVSDRELHVAGIGVVMPVERATVAIVLEDPTPLPEPLPGRSWGDEPHPADHLWDVLAVDGGRETDHLLSALARRGASRSPSLAAALVARDGAAASGERREDRTRARDRIVVSTLAMIVLGIVIAVMVSITQSLGWLIIFVVALAAYFATIARAARPLTRAERKTG